MMWGGVLAMDWIEGWGEEGKGKGSERVKKNYLSILSSSASSSSFCSF